MARPFHFSTSSSACTRSCRHIAVDRGPRQGRRGERLQRGKGHAFQTGDAGFRAWRPPRHRPHAAVAGPSPSCRVHQHRVPATAPPLPGGRWRIIRHPEQNGPLRQSRQQILHPFHPGRGATRPPATRTGPSRRHSSVVSMCRVKWNSVKSTSRYRRFQHRRRGDEAVVAAGMHRVIAVAAGWSPPRLAAPPPRPRARFRSPQVRSDRHPARH